MRFLFPLLGWLLLTGLAPAAEPRSPLSAVPDVADLVLVVPTPARVLDAVQSPALFQEARKLAPVREFFEGTGFRRFQQLLAHVEREMKQPLPQLLDQVAGGGITLATRFGSEPAPFVVVVQGRDEKASARFFALLAELAEQELARQEGAPKLTRGSYQGFDGYAIGNNFFVAHSGSTILFSNKKEALAATIDLTQGKSQASLDKKSQVQEAQKLLPPNPLAWVWFNMEKVRENPEVAEIYKTPREPLATMLFGGYFDLLGRTPGVTLALTQEKEDFSVRVQMPVGRDGMGPDRLLHVGPDGRPASRPLLEPKGVLFSSTFHLDLAAFWNDRAKIFGADVVAGLEQADKGLTQFPLNRIRLSKMLTSTAPYHRFVSAVQPKETGYTKQPKTPVPAFAIITETNNDDFAAGMETIIRGAGLALSGQIRTKLKEEKVGDVTLVGYRVNEEQALPEDTSDFRFAFSPCFARVNNQVLLCSTIELARELIPMLQAEKAADRAASVESRFYGAGFAELLELQKQELITQAILDQAVPAAEARQQVQEVLKLLRSTGGVSLRANYAAKQFDYEIRLRLK